MGKEGVTGPIKLFEFRNNALGNVRIVELRCYWQTEDHICVRSKEDADGKILQYADSSITVVLTSYQRQRQGSCTRFNATDDSSDLST